MSLKVVRDVSIILPTYNEKDNIISLIDSIIDVLDINYELIIVDDNSPDKTYDVVQSHYKNNSQIKSILRTGNRGLAVSIREGLENAKYGHVIVMDTDYTHEPKLISHLLLVAQGYDCVVGSRFCPGGGTGESLHYISSLAFNWLLRIILMTQIQDNLGGYFIARRNLLGKIPLDYVFRGYGEYFFRMLYFMEKNKNSVIEIPAYYGARERGVSKSNYVKMLVHYLVSAIKLRLYKA